MASTSKTYDIVYADPPWRYNFIDKKNSGRNFSGKKGAYKPVISAEDHYDTMSVAEICAMGDQVKAMTSKDALLYLWITGPLLIPCAQMVIEAWGFEYKQVAFVWEKELVQPGAYTMTSVEFCLVAKKKGGKIPLPRGLRSVRQFVRSRRQKHSAKPEEVRTRIERMHPFQNKLEMFARVASPGWDIWGNEVRSSVHLDLEVKDE